MIDIIENIIENSNILIVDDNSKNIQIIGNYLLNKGFKVEFATDGESAIEWTRVADFDLILLDINMPVMDGYEVCRNIKKNPLNHKIPIIFITANTDSESIIQGFEAGAVDYITKPFNHRELIARVKSQIKIKKNRDEIARNLKEIEYKEQLIADSINYARKIQSSVFSLIQAADSHFKESFSLLLPKDILSGDFLWFNNTGNKIIAGVFDCTGHGIPGALMSMLGVSYLNEIVLKDNITEPNLILNRLREKIIESLGQKGDFSEVRDGMDGSIISFDKLSGKLLYSGANSQIYIIRNNELQILRSDRMPVSYHLNMKSFSCIETDLKEDDRIYMLTDGYADQFSSDVNKKFGRQRLRKILLKNHHISLNEQKQILLDELIEWKGKHEQVDDISILGIRI